jgi:HAD superfamily hydrolase (TIGR01484 family)
VLIFKIITPLSQVESLISIDFSKAKSADLRSIKAICFDIDDTFSSHGKITDLAYSSLWSLKRAGFILVPITGRPAGWCDHIARFWPVDAVVGENGAFVFYLSNQKLKRLNTPLGKLSPPQAKAKLADLKIEILKKFKGVRFASDQSYREFDLAIDICEDVSPWSESKIKNLLRLCRARGAIAKLSSIHVNTWFGSYDKRKGFEQFELQLKSKLKLSEWLFIGDSPNDEPLFAHFPMSVGVANLKPYLNQLQSPPTYLTNKESGEGFAEMARRLLAVKKLS